MTGTQTSDQELIDQVLAGNTNLYAALMRKYNQRLYRICKGYMKDEPEIEDLMQETYIKAFVNLKQFEGRSSFSTWITRILINETLQRRKKIAHRNRILTDQTTSTMNVPEKINPESSSLNKELRELIERNLEALPQNYRVVFVMRELEKMNVSETAEVLTISESNVKVRLNRAKEMLRKALLEAYPLDELYAFNLVRCARVSTNVMTAIDRMKVLLP